MQLLDGKRAIFFDLFDTLIRIDESRLPGHRVDGRRIYTTVPLVHEQHLAERDVSTEDFVAALRETAREISREKRASLDEVPAVERWRRVVARLEVAEGSEGEALAAGLAESHARALAAAAVPVEQAREVLERVIERGVDLALISNFDHTPAADWILEGTGLADLIEKRVISEAVGVRKPDSRIFHEALEHFGLEPADCVHVGDQARADAWGAGQLGFRTVWISRHTEPYPEAEHPPTLTVTRLADLLMHL
ncbi:MAG: HAD family hydrolase [Deltaproteobacteria bacterium]|nr:HAD family hydrolase [Deltaproteobacteria bacterium]